MILSQKLHRAAAIFMLSSMLLVYSDASLKAQTAPSSESAVIQHLVVSEGVPLHVILTGKVRFKRGEPVHGRLVEPVFAFDREVLPEGTQVVGHITEFSSASRLVRFTSMASGNFTPVREPQLTFDSLILKDGTTIPILTRVTPGANNVVRFSAGASEEKKSKIATATEMARQQIDAKKRAVIDAIKGPGKMDRVKEEMWSFAPWHPQYLPSASRFNAKLTAPIDFGDISIPTSELADLGTQPAADSIVAARLIPTLDSRTASHGNEVQALLTRPLFSADHHLIFPEGSRLSGTVVQAQAARHWHRGGKLAFMFTRMELPEALARQLDAPKAQHLEGRLDGVEVDNKTGAVQLDEEGGAAADSSKKRFIMPAITTMLAMNGSEGAEPVRVHHIPTGATRNNFGPRIISGGIGFGLIGSAMSRFLGPVGPFLGFYGAGRSIYSNIIGPGQEVTFPADTAIEIRLSGSSATPK
ncbi:MAG TPA: hypothetical protein VKY31_01530 [Terriglobia bacterium]|nr:hypothetical protein [Terriglobia bacterium]